MVESPAVGRVSNYSRQVLLATAIAGGAALLVFLLWKASDILLLVFAGVLLGVFLYSIAEKLQRWLAPGWAFTLVVLAFLLLLALGVWYLIPVALEAWHTLASEVPRALGQTRSALQDTAWGSAVLERLGDGMSGGGGDAGGLVGSVVSRVAGIFSTVMGAVVGILAVLLVGLYAGAEPRVYTRGAMLLVPPARRERAGQVLGALRHTLLWWILGRLMSMAVVALLTWLGLLLLGVPLAVALALLAGLLSFIPNIGPILSAVPALLMGLAQSPWTAAQVAILYLAVQTVESYFITPMIQRRAVSMPPALIITVQLIFGTLFGFLGLLLATPITVSVAVLTKMLYVEDVLGDRVELS
jgi:predicted PurR-regulated permease PerM